jgi:DNA-directed RNA polymerase specialized sigma24 family protein
VAENVSGERELTRISEALDELAQVDPSLAELVDLKFFCGFSYEELANLRQVSVRTLKREFEQARIYLHRRVRPDPAP